MEATGSPQREIEDVGEDLTRDQTESEFRNKENEDSKSILVHPKKDSVCQQFEQQFNRTSEECSTSPSLKDQSYEPAIIVKKQNVTQCETDQGFAVNSHDPVASVVTVEGSVESDTHQKETAELDDVQVKKCLPEETLSTPNDNEIADDCALSNSEVPGSIAHGSKSPSTQNDSPETEMDALLQEESERLDKLSLPFGNDTTTQKETDKEHQYKRLIQLLTKSQFYTEFLVKKLQTQEEANKKGSKKRGRRKGSDRNGDNCTEEKQTGTSSYSPKKVHISNSEQVMAIAADVISNKRLHEDNVEEEADNCEEPDPGLTKTLENGLVVPMDQPSLLTGACLRNYQIEGLHWLKLLFENGVNGILADEMGLGKTIQVIALISHLVEKNVRGPFLIIGPLSTLPNWAIEFERFTPQIPFVLYHGSEDKRVQARKAMMQKQVVEGHKVYPIVITSYEYPLRDMNVLKKLKWRYIIIDEGHRLKNHNSQLSRALRRYTSANRLLLTGTPLHNSLSELWALLNFLVPEIFDDLEIFESWFKVEDLSSKDGDVKLVEEEKKKKILSTMHKILSPFMLRRVKSEVDLNLPPKKELVVYAPMTSIQVDLYKAVLDYNMNMLIRKPESSQVLESEDGKRLKRTCTTTKKFYNMNELFRLEDELGSNEGSDIHQDKKTLVVQDKENKNYAIRVQMRNIGMMMRKIVNHPYLVQYPLEPGTEYARIDEDIVKTSGKLQVLDAMLTKLKERGHKVLLFSTFTSLIDILEDYLSLRPFRYVRLDGGTSLEDRQVFIKQFNSDPDLFIFLISTRAGGLGINLAAADTVILYDSDWNPQVDLQAQDRCHRIGQTRPVVVYRFVTAGTVDERIVVRASAKRKLEKLIIHKGNYSAFQKQEDNIDLEELQMLLKSRDHQGVIHPNGFDAELDELLDRTLMIEGEATCPTSEEASIEARPFKEYYGYVGKKDVNGTEEANSNVQIVDQDSNDTPFDPSVVKRSPMKKTNGVSKIAEHASATSFVDILQKGDSPRKRCLESISGPSKKFKPSVSDSEKTITSNNKKPAARRNRVSSNK